MSTKRLIRSDIQALRAIAVLMVVVFHLWPNHLTGGFAGVDVFFVISGFLISGSLFAELDDTGRIRFAAFWARRVRRLLPAALTVIALTAVAALMVVPPLTRSTFFTDAIASTFYVENWHLAANATNYFADQPSPFQHFWSLAVEEQFYIVWPLLIAAVALLAKSRRISSLKWFIFAISTASFVYSVWLSFSQPDLAYFTTLGRVWQFGLGAAIALLGHRLRFSTLGKWALSLGGFTLILISAFALNSSMPFPGWVALAPALGAAAVILAGLQGLPENLRRVLSFKPIAFTGDISYSLYLWHWPLIILLPWATGYQLRTYQLALILVVSYALAWASKRFIEDRFRSLPLLTARLPRASFAFGLAISILVFGISLTGQVITSSQQSSAANRVQTLDQAKNDTADPNHRCMTDPDSSEVKICRFGVLDADYRVLLVGDSHAAMHLGAWQILAEQGRFEVDLAYKASCSFNLEKRNDSARGSSCQAWNIALQKQLATDKKYDLVVTSYFTTVKATEIESANHDDLAVAGFKAAWAPLQARGTQVLVVRDGVNMSPSMRDCWQSAVYDASKCSMPESQAFGTDLAMRAASSPPGALTMDFSDLYCQNGICPAKIGKLYVYRDSSHISLAFSRSMAKDWLVRMTEIGIKLPHPAS